jgi:hypothetical protein
MNGIDVRVVCAGADSPLCTISRAPGTRQRIASACMHGLCRKLASEFQLRAWDDYRKPLEKIWEERGVPASDVVTSDEHTQPSATQGPPWTIEHDALPLKQTPARFRWLAIDVDNDGRRELVALAEWHGPRWGPNYHFFAEDGAVYRLMDPQRKWRGWDAARLPDLASGEALVFERFDELTYVVAIRVHPRFRDRGRLLEVFLVRRDRVDRVGAVEIVRDWRVSLKRLSK